MAEPVIEPEVAVIVVLPIPVPVAKPPAAMVATAVESEFQVAVPVRFCVEPSL